MTTTPPRGTAVTASVVAGVVLAYGFLTFPGLLNDGFMHMAWAQQWTLGAWPGRDFVDPGMPLQIALSALAQLSLPGPLGETLLACTCLAVAAGATCLGVSWLSGSVVAGVIATVFQVVLQPRLYSYPKIVVPAAMLVLGLLYVRRPGRWTQLALAAGVAGAFLFRHDLGGYAALCAAVTVGVSCERAADRWHQVLHVGLMTIALLMPYLLYVVTTEGLLLHVHQGREFFAGEIGQFVFAWPAVAWSRAGAAAVLFYLSYALPGITLLILWRRGAGVSRGEAAVVAGMAALGVAYAAVILRSPLEARVPDLGAIVAILGTWSLVALLRQSPAIRKSGRTVSLAWLRQGVGVGVAIVVFVSAAAVGQLRTQVIDTGILEGPGGVARRTRFLMEDGTRWPWASYWPGGMLPALIGDLRACTSPADRIFVSWFAPEYYVFAQRSFAAGQAILVPPSFAGDADQRRMLARLDGEPVPVALVNLNERDAFRGTYGLVAQYLDANYREVDRVALSNDVAIAVLVRQERPAEAGFPQQGWPCSPT